MKRNAARMLVDQLLVHGVDRAFCVPGESFLAVIDALADVQDRCALIVCRHEGGAGNMAEAHAKATGQVGVCFVTRGPGAFNAAIALHTAQQDSTPLVLFVGQVGTDFVGREAFQEVDYRRVFGSIAKWVTSIDRADRVPELVAHAFQVAASGRPGPVVVALPEDVLLREADVPDARAVVPVRPTPSAAAMARVQALLAGASRPIAIVAGRGWTPGAVAALEDAAERWALPVACAFRYQDSFDNGHPHYAGDVGIGINPKLAARIRDADCVLAIGPRLGEMTTQGYTLFDAPVPRQPLVHVHPSPDELGTVYQAQEMITSGVTEFVQALAALPLDAQAEDAVEARRGHVAAAHADYEAWQQPRPQPGPVDWPQIVRWLSAHVPDDTLFTSGAGNFATPLHRFHRHRAWPTQLAPTSGAMGYAVPAAVAAKLAYPDRLVVAVAGDGDFLMTSQELATAAQYGAPFVTLVIDNGMYGTIRMHQEREYPARVYGTALRNPDFVGLGVAYGCHAERVERTDDFAAAFVRACDAVARGQGALLHLPVDPQALTPGLTLDEIRAQGLARQG